MNKDGIVYSIEGFDQEQALNLGMDVTDLVLLRWFVTFKDSGNMASLIIKNDKYYWVRYGGIEKQLPILRLTKDVIGRRFRKMAKIGVLKNETVKQGGTFSYFATGEKYYLLMPTKNKVNQVEGTTLKAEGTTLKADPMFSKAEGYDFKNTGGTTLKTEGCVLKVATNNSNTINSNTKDSNTRTEKNKDICNSIDNNKESEKQITPTPIPSIPLKTEDTNYNSLTKEHKKAYDTVGKIHYNMFLKACSIVETTKVVEIIAPNAFTESKIKQKYLDKLKTAFNKPVTIAIQQRMDLEIN